jgi:predicted TPR repeat methyltransferase
MKPITAIEHYEGFAQEYDPLSKKHEWYSPEVLFGLMFEYLQSGEKLLDIGIGTGQSAIPFHSVGIQIYGIEGSNEMLRKCKEKGIAKDLKQIDLNTIPPLPYKDNDFQYVISNGVLYFFENLEPFFIEAKRILKSNGIFAFTIENLKSGYSKKYTNKDNDLISKRIIEKVGVEVFRHSDEYVGNLIKKYNFEVLKKFEYFAYHSPTENKDIYFKAFILKK